MSSSTEAGYSTSGGRLSEQIPVSPSPLTHPYVRAGDHGRQDLFQLGDYPGTLEGLFEDSGCRTQTGLEELYCEVPPALFSVLRYVLFVKSLSTAAPQRQRRVRAWAATAQRFSWRSQHHNSPRLQHISSAHPLAQQDPFECASREQQENPCLQDSAARQECKHHRTCPAVASTAITVIPAIQSSEDHGFYVAFYKPQEGNIKRRRPTRSRKKSLRRVREQKRVAMLARYKRAMKGIASVRRNLAR